jgi:hypothetical protein
MRLSAFGAQGQVERTKAERAPDNVMAGALRESGAAKPAFDHIFPD